jgi:hypothetical protein
MVAATKSCSVEATITAARTRNRLDPKLGFVLDLTGCKSGGEVYWRKAGSERFTPIHRGAKNYNGVPAQYFFLARKWRALVW